VSTAVASGSVRGRAAACPRARGQVDLAAEAPLIRRATLADLDGLVALEARFTGDRLSRRAWRRHLASPRALCLVAASAGGLLGDVLLLRRADSAWWRLYSLVRAAAAPPGTGRRLLEAGLGAARAAGAAGVRLEVRADNAGAIRLYQDLGFTLFATVDGYYEDGAAALRMALAFVD
jgi:[ribosomal protein S18]-alanine N-acetyltransferase